MITYIKNPAHISTDNNAVGPGSGPLTAQSQLASECVHSLHGFIVTAFAFEEFLTYNSFHYALHSLMQLLDTDHYSNLLPIADTAQSLLLSGKMPPSLRRSIINAYHELGINEPVIVESHNFTANGDRMQEDMGEGHDNTKTVSGDQSVLTAVQNCFAALYIGEAIKYRQDNNCVHDKAALSVTVQKMMRLPLPNGLTGPGSFN
ncbi:MAG: PEP/pyruvate-binding domain-containing protein [Bacteroidota bacterium]